MIPFVPLQLAQDKTLPMQDWAGMGLALGAFLAIPCGVVAFFYIRAKTSNTSRELAKRNYEDNERRNQAAFDHNLESAKLNDQKQRLECRMLELQIQLAESELAARREHGDVGDLMTEKTRLEIESLRLHIRDQRKGGLPDYDD